MGYASTTCMVYGIPIPDELAEQLDNKHGDDLECYEFDCPCLMSDGTDSRCHSLNYEEGYQHYFGIFMTSKGYYDYGNMNDVINGKVDLDNYHKMWEEECLPLLEGMDNIPKPMIHSVTQVW